MWQSLWRRNIAKPLTGLLQSRMTCLPNCGQTLKSRGRHTIIAPMSTATTSQAPASGGTITLTVNGEARTLPSGATLDALLQHLGLEPKKMAIERNLEIVPKSLYGETVLDEGDRIEIVQFVGGG